ncbi:peptidoglycan DD-metalloendopeptidase family protein [Heliobacillus mobilis]|uniref:Peptidoglycan DD-metalloendopeptidase family protein n=1 Tax=Heliobacterium mobile TaxID=28064 RepID=A0A6I3SPJ9_HELMO|nr:M23 family metallopeptidase [Heliobacterium mobile]MTV50177.1 peptidoglycan DD-metalloendopeptidase family protein [Heliobacterium mobile]
MHITALPNPIPGATLTDTFGAPRKETVTHDGIDIFAVRGTPIYATTGGVVEKVGVNAIGGNRVGIRDDDGNYHYYAHLSAYGDVRVGDHIAAGTIVGYVGNTGNARTTPPHLHYGIRSPEGDWVNPYPFLAAAESSGTNRVPASGQPFSEKTSFAVALRRAIHALPTNTPKAAPRLYSRTPLEPKIILSFSLSLPPAEEAQKKPLTSPPVPAAPQSTSNNPSAEIVVNSSPYELNGSELVLTLYQPTIISPVIRQNVEKRKDPPFRFW